MAVIIGSGKDAYRYNPENPRDVSDRVNSFEDRGRLPNIPDNLITNEMRLENLVDNKDYFKNQPSPTRPGMNVYQDRMQDFRTSSPEAMQTYADRFPLTQFMMTAPEKIARSTMLGNVISSIGGGFNKAKNFAGGLFPGDNTMLNNMAGDFAALPSKFKKDAGQMISDFQNLTPDLDKGVSAFRDFLGVKKNNATDIAETALGDETLDQESNAEEQFYGGRSPMDEMFANTGIASQLFGRQYMKEDMRGFGNNVAKVNQSLDQLQNQQENFGSNINAALDAVLKRQGIIK
jgi:hypothetical protein